jgi:hypothetical protein
MRKEFASYWHRNQTELMKLNLMTSPELELVDVHAIEQYCMWTGERGAFA